MVWNFENIHALIVNLWAVFMYFHVTIYALLELRYTMAVLYTVVKVGGGTGQGLAIATEVYFVASVLIPLQTLASS